MRNWVALVIFSVQAVLLVRASDGPIDWNKAPGGGPSRLRVCARWVFISNTAVNLALGCDSIGCVCRPDLIDKAHDYIKDKVIHDCGDDATVDVEQAMKLYNDYCSANGYAVPGYTYIITQTARTQPAEGTATGASRAASRVTSGAARRSSTTDSQEDLVTTTTAAGNTIVTVTATVITTAITTGTTIIAQSSASPQVQTLTWLHLLCFLVLLPGILVFGLPQTSVVYFTPTPLPPAYTSIVTSLKSDGPPAYTLVVTSFKADDPTAPVISTKLVPYSSQRAPNLPTDAPNTDDNTRPSANNSGGGKNALSKLEVAGIVIGILVGLVTGPATVWMCIRGDRGFFYRGTVRDRRDEQPLDNLTRRGNVYNARDDDFIR